MVVISAVTVYFSFSLLLIQKKLALVENVAPPNTMNRLAVYSYLTRYLLGPARSGRLFIEPLPEKS